jgi:hypothetical protein
MNWSPPYVYHQTSLIDKQFVQRNRLELYARGIPAFSGAWAYNSPKRPGAQIVQYWVILMSIDPAPLGRETAPLAPLNKRIHIALPRFHECETLPRGAASGLTQFQSFGIQCDDEPLSNFAFNIQSLETKM